MNPGDITRLIRTVVDHPHADMGIRLQAAIAGQAIKDLHNPHIKPAIREEARQYVINFCQDWGLQHLPNYAKIETYNSTLYIGDGESEQMREELAVRQDAALTSAEHELAVAQVANEYAAANAFADYNRRKSPRTILTHRMNLGTFAEFLSETGIQRAADELQHEPERWAFVNYGIVTAFRQWMLNQGFAVASINNKLSTVRTYVDLAAGARVIDATEKILIASVKGYSQGEVQNVDRERETARMGRKKATHTAISTKDAERLKTQPDTPQGHRDAVLMALLLDHGLRASEVAGLTVENINLDDKSMRFYRPKVKREQTHTLTSDTLKALKAYMPHARTEGPLLRGSRKGGSLTDASMNTANISKRVKQLGKDIGIDNLSAHDCRHYWATYWAQRVDRLPKGLFSLQEAGGWSSLVMPRRYVEESVIANEGME